MPGGFGDRGIEGKVAGGQSVVLCWMHIRYMFLAACRYARENRIPFLGICLGLQCAVIEFARNVLGIEGANSTEFVTSELDKSKQVYSSNNLYLTLLISVPLPAGDRHA